MLEEEDVTVEAGVTDFSTNGPPVVIPDSDSDHLRTLRAADILIRHLELALTPRTVPNPGQHHPVPVSLSMFSYGLMRALEAVGGPAGRRFLDVGAGIGTKLILARYLAPGLTCEGIEIQPGLANKANELGANVYLADAMEWDRYGEYDIVFSYLPCADTMMEERLERRVQGMMRPGAVLFFVGGRTTPLMDEWEEVSGSVWRKLQ